VVLRFGDKMKICEIIKISGMNTPSARLKNVGGQAGEFIRWVAFKKLTK